MAIHAIAILLVAALGATESLRADEPELIVDPGLVALSNFPLSFTLTIPESPHDEAFTVQIDVDENRVATKTLSSGSHSIVLDDVRLRSGRHLIAISTGDLTTEVSTRVIPGWISVLPPLVAIFLALVTKEVLISLFCGIFAGALFIFDLNPFTALARTIDRYVVSAASDPDQATILIFTTLLGGMVGLISRSGGTLAIVDRMRRLATNAIRGQFATWMLGLVIFFDDYSNILIVGSTMRPITDRLRISREKLAYIVDSTAAPISSIFPISSWIGFEVGLIAAAFASLSLPFNPYITFIQSIPYRFYPIFALVLGFTIAVSGKDFGPMLSAERRARKSGKVLDDNAVPLADLSNDRLTPDPEAPRRAINAIVPILAVVIVTIGGLIITGSEGIERSNFETTGSWLREVFGNSNSFAALAWASLTGVVLALLLPLTQRIFTARAGVEAMVEGFRSVYMALIVLILAWSIGSVCADLHTADYLVGLSSGVLSPRLLPVMTFVLSALVAFATGTSWGTLGILMPLVIPLAHNLSLEAGMAVDSSMYSTILIGTVSSILAGSVWGDHCSPISDTTILSSMASGSDHIAHVRTQLPYALTAGIVAMLAGDLPTAFGLSPWISLVLGSAVIVAIVLWLGKRSEPSEGLQA